MPSGWDVYYVVFLSALLALAIPSVLGLISYFVVPKHAAEPPKKAEEAEVTVMAQRVNARFFLAANTALILITLGLVLIPCVGALQPGGSHQTYGRGLIAIVTVAGFAALGLLYSARKGDLSWLRSFQERK
jgi:NADH:ubiquinone oxidoreductase subunit 3 (subunit A)